MLKILPRIYRAGRLGLLQDGTSESYGVKLQGPRLDATFHMIARENYGDFVMESLRGAESSLAFLDIGANIGLFSCALYAHFEGKVHSFEPNPTTFSYLQKNLLANKAENARAWCAGIFDAESGAHRSGASSMVNKYDVTGTRISLMTPNDLSKIMNPSDRYCLKVDVEGVEKNVILALQAAKVLERTDRIVIEMSENTSDAKTLDDIREILFSAGLSLSERKGSPTHADELFIRE